MGNFLEAANYWLENEDINESSTADGVINKLISMFNIDLTKFANPKTLGAFLSQNTQSIGKAVNIAKSLTEDTMVEGERWDSFINKLTSIPKDMAILVVIAMIAFGAKVAVDANSIYTAITNGDITVPTIPSMSSGNASVIYDISQAIADFEKRTNLPFQSSQAESEEE